jgi:hypothetical protein
MYDFIKIGQEVTFQGLLDIKLIVEEVNEVRGNARCKYYDHHLKRYIKLTLPVDALIPIKKEVKKKLPISGLKKAG